jgi:GAF domain-containing protein
VNPPAPRPDRVRLRDVARLGLDQEASREYLDELVEEVATRLGTPFAVVDVLLDDAQVFLAGRGPMPQWITEARGTPMEWAFCAKFLDDRAPWSVSDLSAHPAHRDNPLVRVEGLRSYIGAPLVSSSDHVLGGLCALDVEPRRFTGDDLDFLARMAAETVRRIELHADAAS